jgi:phenylacetate-CoA ligase
VGFKIFDIALKLSGFPIARATRFLDTVTSRPEAGYADFTEKAKRDIVKFHLKHNALYRNIVGKDSFENWEDLPVMKKSDFQQSLDARLSEGYSRKNVFINKTSGSGGDPFVFAKDKFCHALIWANIQRRWNWYGIDFNTSLQARFYGMPLDFFANAKLRVKDSFSNRYRFNIFDFSDAAIAKMLAVFKRRKFDYINGYTSNIVLLAKYLQRENTVLKSVCPTLKVCITTSEMLFDDDRKLIETWLGVSVVNEYGAAELDIIAFESPDGFWKVNAETLFVEIADETGNALPNGKEGRIVVTSLYNKAMPMIRYDVGDVGILDEKSTAKNPILKKLSGRTSDVAVLPSGKLSPGMTFYSITKRLFDDEGIVNEFVIVQTKKDTFEIRYTAARELNEPEKSEIARVFDQFLETGLTYVFRKQDKIDRAKSGKLKQFTSLVQ